MEEKNIISAQAEKISELEDLILKYRFKNKDLCWECLTHKSFNYEINSYNFNHYERLEFLGDAVLDLVITEMLMNHYPDYQEGELSRLRSSYVNESALAMAARRHNLGEYLLIGKGEEATGGRDKDSILADVMESVIGAVYLDGGLDAATEVILRLIPKLLYDSEDNGVSKDFKSMVQEFAQKKWRTRPEYFLISEQGPDHEKIFQVELSINGKVYGSGEGRSKKEAEQEAAKEAWIIINSQDMKIE
jgi:ribonuclease-3